MLADGGQTPTSCLLLRTLSGSGTMNEHDALCNCRDGGHLKPRGPLDVGWYNYQRLSGRQRWGCGCRGHWTPNTATCVAPGYSQHFLLPHSQPQPTLPNWWRPSWMRTSAMHVWSPVHTHTQTCTCTFNHHLWNNDRFSKFLINKVVPPHLKHVTILPFEIFGTFMTKWTMTCLLLHTVPFSLWWSKHSKMLQYERFKVFFMLYLIPLISVKCLSVTVWLIATAAAATSWTCGQMPLWAVSAMDSVCAVA